MQSRYSLLVLLVVLTSSMLNIQPLSAAPRERCFSETGFCVSGAILDYWEKKGGLRVFGYPMSELRTETNRDGWTGPTQWFERDRLEDHANQGYAVLAGRLGAQYLEMRATPWQEYERVGQAPAADCRFFAITGHSLCGKFKTYWEKNGGLERFGYPITEPFYEDLPEFSGTVQYFERRRMEYHPELAGTSYEVLLGLLGHDTQEPGCKTIIRDLVKTAEAHFNAPCSVNFPQVNIPIVVQSFENGSMIWTPNRNAAGGQIWVTYYNKQKGWMMWQFYADLWREGMPISAGETPPPGLYEPVRGFGKLWREDPTVRAWLGWATSPELQDHGHTQFFNNGVQMIYRFSADRVWLLYITRNAEDVARVH